MSSSQRKKKKISNNCSTGARNRKYILFCKKVGKSKAEQEIGKMALEQLPGVYEKLSCKMKNKKLTKILCSDKLKTLVNYGAAYCVNKL